MGTPPLPLTGASNAKGMKDGMHSRYCTVEDGHETSRGLSATAELLAN